MDNYQRDIGQVDENGNPRFFFSRGLKFPRNYTILTQKMRGLLRNDNYERKETEAALKVVTQDDVVLELGGGVGYMSTLIAKKCKAKEVHTFEANPGLIPYIKAVHAANNVDNVHVTNALLGTRKGKANFYIRPNPLGSSMEILEDEPHSSVETIDVVNAKTAFDQIKPTILICDIEGAEAHLIPQLPLDGLRGAILELHPQWIGQDGVQAVFNAMAAANLTYYAKASEGKVVTFLKGW